MAHTAFEVTLFFDWFEYLERVAYSTGVNISSALVKHDQAIYYAQAGDFDSAYPHAVGAVDDARATLRYNNLTLKAVCDSLIDSISSTMYQAQSEGINVNAFLIPYANSVLLYNAEDYIAAVSTLSSLNEDLWTYVSHARTGLPVDALSGSYDIPEGTTDIIAINYMHPEAGGWIQERYSPDVIMEQVRTILAGQGVSLVGIRHIPPRIIIFVRGSPITPAIAALIIKLIIVALVCATLMVIALAYWGATEAQAERDMRIGEMSYNFKSRLLGDLEEGKISPATYSKISDNWDEGINSILEAGGPGIIEMLVWAIPAIVGVWVIGTLISALRRK